MTEHELSWVLVGGGYRWSCSCRRWSGRGADEQQVVADHRRHVAMSATCGAPCPYGGTSAARKYSSAALSWMGHCNRRVRSDGDRCWQHQERNPKGEAA